MINTLMNHVNDLDEKVDDLDNSEFKKKYSEIVKALIDEVYYTLLLPVILFKQNIEYPGMKADKFTTLTELREFIGKYKGNFIEIKGDE